MTCKVKCGRVTPSQAHCGVCHRTFGGVTGFDRHRKDGECLTPESFGLEFRNGAWRFPAPEFS